MDMSDAVIANSSRLKSIVWNDFDRVKKGDTFVAICRHCKKKLSGSSTSGTSHLRNHLIRCQRRSNHGIAQYFSGREKKKEGSLAVVTIDQEQKKDEVLSLVNLRYEQEQIKNEPVTIGNSSLDQRRSQFDLARMIILHNYPLDMVDHVGFKIFVRNLQPLFELVTYNKVEADCMEIYAKEKQRVYEVLDKFPGKISVTADVWTASDDSAYLSLTAHYIDEDWQLKKRILNFVTIDPSHTEDMHSEVIMTCLMDWDIDLDLLNRMVQDALDALCEVTQKIRDGIRYGLSWQVSGIPGSGKDSRDRLMGFDKFLHETSQRRADEVGKILWAISNSRSFCPSLGCHGVSELVVQKERCDDEEGFMGLAGVDLSGALVP
ncbi:zinc finger protein [Theobroma cacao]|nr:zinc finger protein [Theobroma cacao]